ncbi:transcription-repair coupling factor [Tuwongella immobilis]|uniref:Transcription-repair-coupling factor n=1 Tax=Tuwongella immobilis TaxID=692036 RepID=A0A6C2YJY0_9BACT|nr:transcription-repair coupling factor [Tuwongella immobilis]VIP01415.1 transcription-repair coupling factor : Transcription-repair-coupling factor OS=Singulisphaera acidiphila (strain ATCC BAA-1392 / DSM 18658 / VKM B-2454 / MOB10) GN=mfd PE=3 SV=1: CarD_CdnL_TRCF: DEAD: Helicase_C: TRCF [Tuwongella immobilis]VTR98337.1 transcription-repair coupling factor : Transcription-repair-coupling factor OS=Singulisphaera acidiphila (strain ATCC BAA-1392 / DSM 18658 / VKM B-2454 / MOB10) GN=mfd PE=3 SV=1
MPTLEGSLRLEQLRDLTRLLETNPNWPELLGALRANASATIDGAWGSAAALATAALAEQTPGTLLVVLPHSGDLTAWGEDLLGFRGERPMIFPAWESWPIDPNSRDEIAGQRLRLVQQLDRNPPKVLLTSLAALMQPVPTAGDLESARRWLRVGESIDLDALLEWLVARGYKRVEAVEHAGEFSRRGGIVDLFSPDAEDPIRLELFGDEIESIRSFSAQSQRSLDDLKEAAILGGTPGSSSSGGSAKHPTGHLTEHLPPGSWVILSELAELREQGKVFLERVSDPTGLFSVAGTFAQLVARPSVHVTAMPSASLEKTCHLHVVSVERFSGNVNRVRDELDSIATTETVLIAAHNEPEKRRLEEVLAAGKLATSDRLRLVMGQVRAGFRIVSHDSQAGVIVLGSHELFHREWTPTTPTGNASGLPKRRIESRAIDSFLELNPGDYVVHVAHGIAIYRGMRMLDRGQTAPPPMMPGEVEDDTSVAAHRPAREEHLVLEFRDGLLVYVPVSKIDLVQKYVGGSRTLPELSKFGGTSWQRKKDKVEEAVHDLASDMLQLQAVRASQTGFAYPTNSEWQTAFEATFPYQETPDQLAAISEIYGDMEKPRSMDRLLCGDVGYGKTEVAIRAVFKAIDNGKQVALLVPTTVLAEQHYRTFRDRLAAYPFEVEVISRFRSAAQQKKVLKQLAEGTVDVIIGTHRLVSKDVRFKDLGLVIIDEEQRFGVDHKERLKHLRATVDVLTLSATPIPRTLHLALLGIREISNLETPPPERIPVETRIIRWDEQIIRNAILREFNRDGQVYFVHNRVHDIDAVKRALQSIVPEARIVIGHGQMAEGELEAAMLKFVRKEADILLATTIIESGLDIPNANTIFINEAENYGLADLHQLRGRVGRQKLRAYAYLILQPNKLVTETAAKRLKAIEEFTDLGAGFKIAMRDLEIRGAGNILGNEQSGHIASVGYELYCQLLENAVRGMKKLPLKTPLEVNLDLPWPAYLPREYVPTQKLRIEVYRRLARIRDLRKLDDFREELRDRYGALPDPAEWLLRQTEIRLLAARWQVQSIHRDNRELAFTYRVAKRIHELVKLSGGQIRVIDEKTAFMRLTPADDDNPTLYDRLRSLLRIGMDPV